MVKHYFQLSKTSLSVSVFKKFVHTNETVIESHSCQWFVKKKCNPIPSCSWGCIVFCAAAQLKIEGAGVWVVNLTRGLSTSPQLQLVPLNIEHLQQPWESRFIMISLGWPFASMLLRHNDLSLPFLRCSFRRVNIKDKHKASNSFNKDINKQQLMLSMELPHLY